MLSSTVASCLVCGNGNGNGTSISVETLYILCQTCKSRYHYGCYYSTRTDTKLTRKKDGVMLVKRCGPLCKARVRIRQTEKNQLKNIKVDDIKSHRKSTENIFYFVRLCGIGWISKDHIPESVRFQYLENGNFISPSLKPRPPIKILRRIPLFLSFLSFLSSLFSLFLSFYRLATLTVWVVRNFIGYANDRASNPLRIHRAVISLGYIELQKSPEMIFQGLKELKNTLQKDILRVVERAAPFNPWKIPSSDFCNSKVFYA